MRKAIVDLTWHGWITQIGDRVFFDSNSSTLTDPAKAVLDRWVFFLSKNPQSHLVIEGHADDQGPGDINRALGLKRATAVKDYLVTHDIDEARIRTISYGKERPAVLIGGDAEAARAQNRRAVGILE